MIRPVAFVVCIVVALPCSAQFVGQGFARMDPWTEWNVKVEGLSGQTATGTLSLGSIRIEFDLGQYTLKPQKVKTVRFSDHQQAVSFPHGGMGGMGMETQIQGVVVTHNDEEISGTLYIGQWELQTDLGTIVLAPQRLKEITFLEPVGTDEPQAEPSAPEVETPAQEQDDQEDCDQTKTDK